MPHAFLSPHHLSIANDLLGWSREYLMTENSEIKRPAGTQEVCPFVGPSVENNSFYMVFHPEVNGFSEGHIEEILLDYIEPFKRIGPFEPADKLKIALLVVFPNIPEDETRILDIAHKSIKSKFVEAGLMVGQFHKNCDDRGVHNRSFRVSISPHPLVAIRHMAPHDIIFLKGEREWFMAYNVRYGDRFREPERIEDYNRPFLEHYLSAKRQFLS